ncbi:MAG: periplasmic heavy metal sensor [Pelagimonas sp.]|jgi:uncharacterized membrane protein|nr:periplasmic heavy metal sensor [Pelagimonas sp.]
MTTPEPAPRMRPWLKIVLFGSLAVNLLVVGLAVGMALKGPMGRDRPPGRDYVTPYTRAFDAEQRKALRRAFFAMMRAQPKKSPGGFVRGYEEALEILRAEPFDPDQLRSHLKQQAEASDARRTQGQNVVVEFIAGMPAEERKAFAARLEVQIEELKTRRDTWRGKSRDKFGGGKDHRHRDHD